MATETNEPPKKKKPTKPAAHGASPFVAVLRAAAGGNYVSRVDLTALTGEEKEVGALLNELLKRVGAEQNRGLGREEMQHLLESAQAALSALVSHGDLAGSLIPVRDHVGLDACGEQERHCKDTQALGVDGFHGGS